VVIVVLLLLLLLLLLLEVTRVRVVVVEEIRILRGRHVTRLLRVGEQALDSGDNEAKERVKAIRKMGKFDQRGILPNMFKERGVAEHLER
jgi:hypothetical protein